MTRGSAAQNNMLPSVSWSRSRPLLGLSGQGFGDGGWLRKEHESRR